MTAKANILVVEDERVVALDIQMQLQSLGYHVPATVSNGASAVQKALEVHPDLVLMDIRLKGDMDGIQAAHRIRAHADIPVVYLTAYADAETLERAKVTEPVGYLLKPFEQRELDATIEMALYKHRAEHELKAYATRLERANSQLRLINHLLAAAADGHDHRSMLQLACCELAKAMDLPYAAATLLDKGKTSIHVLAEHATSGRQHVLGEIISLSLVPQVQSILDCREPTVVDNAQTNTGLGWLRELFDPQKPVSLLLVPLVVGGDVIGGLALAASSPHHFSSEEIESAGTVAGQLASALDRVWLEEERRRLSTAIEQGSDGVMITDPQGIILYANPAIERISGYSRAELIEQTPHLLQSGPQEEASYGDIRATLRSNQTWQGRVVHRRKDGTCYTADATITPLHDKNGQAVAYVNVQRDVTHVLEMEEQHRQAMKMEAVGRLAAGIAHDFNNLLTAITGYATLIEVGMAAEDDVAQMARVIRGSADRAAGLTKQLLAFSRKEMVEPQVLNLNELVSGLHDMMQRTLGEHIALRWDPACDLWLCKVDPTQIERVVLNLAVNARDAMPDGGSLTISTANVTLGQEGLGFDLQAQLGEYVALRVQDTGVGMTQDVQGHLFEPFFTTKDVGKGTGLGLATVYGIVKQSGGTIRVHSVEGQGATFEVYLPRTDEADQPLTAQTAAEPAARPSNSHVVLLVEDNELVRLLVKQVLGKEGYTVLEAEDGLQAQELAQTHSGSVQLLLTDVVMPHMNGKALADQLRQEWPNLKVLYMSGYTDDAIVHHGVLEPDIKLIRKPFSPRDLARRVREMLLDADRETTVADCGNRTAA